MRNFFIYLALVITPLVTFADTSNFLISVFGGEDLEPPTTPTLLSVTPVAATQIDVTWSASTDNIQLNGYVLFRDSVAIATTTLTTFFDTGLTASTTYSYEVYAFDAFGNISTTSNTLATTTLPAPVTPPPATSTNPSSATLVFGLVDLQVVASPNTALFAWETTLPSRFALRWGRNQNYDDGYIQNDIYRREHQTVVSGLEPGTVYVFELIGYTPTGRSVVLERGEFTTERGFVSAPSNVSGLTATILDADVRLTYTLPTSVPDARVRIVRSHLGFPNDIYDGAVVYEGSDAVFLDQGALATYSTQYYTIFVIAADGSVSSGAVVRASSTPTAPAMPPAATPSPVTSPSSTTPTTPILPLPAPEIPLLDFGFDRGAITLLQEGKTYSFNDEAISLVSTEEFIIRIEKTTLPDNLKSLVVTILDPNNPTRSYSFLLRINKDGTAYEAAIAPLQASGTSRVEVEIFDFERQIVGRYQKLVSFTPPEAGQAEVIFPDKIIATLGSFFTGAVWIFLAVFLLLFLLYRRSREGEDKL